MLAAGLELICIKTSKNAVENTVKITEYTAKYPSKTAKKAFKRLIYSNSSLFIVNQKTIAENFQKFLDKFLVLNQFLKINFKIKRLLLSSGDWIFSEIIRYILPIDWKYAV